jgi:monoamine oxidase
VSTAAAALGAGAASSLAGCQFGGGARGSGLHGRRGTLAGEEDLASAESALSKRNARVVIVGAGLAGMAAAHELRKRGYDPRVYEAGGRIGGRTFTDRTTFPIKCELGGELIDSGHKKIRRLAQELGLNLVDQLRPIKGYEAERYFIGGVHYTEAQAIEAFRPVAAKLEAAWQAQGGDYLTYYDTFTPAGRALDLLSIEEWFDRNGVHGFIRTLLDTAYTGEYGRNIDEQSFINLLYLIDTNPDPLRLFGESDEKFTVREGNDAIVHRIARALPTAPILRHALVAVARRADGSVVATFESGARTTDVVCDRLILALPFNQLRKCALRVELPPPKALAIRDVPYGTNSKLMVGTASRPWYQSNGSGTSFSDVLYNESWESSRGFDTPTGVLTCFNGGRLGVELGRGSVGDRVRDFLGQVDRAFPGTRASYNGKAVRFAWPTARYFEGSYACYKPGDWTTFVGSESEPEGNIHFAGEHTSVDFQGFMEGAVESGQRAAMEVHRALR